MLSGYKTYIAALGTVCTALVAYMDGKMDIATLIQTVGASAIFAALRSAIEGAVTKVIENASKK